MARKKPFEEAPAALVPDAPTVVVGEEAGFLDAPILLPPSSSTGPCPVCGTQTKPGEACAVDGYVSSP